VLRIGLGASAEKHVGILFFPDIALAQNRSIQEDGEIRASSQGFPARYTLRAAEHLPLRPTYRRDTRLRCLENALVWGVWLKQERRVRSSCNDVPRNDEIVLFDVDGLNNAVSAVRSRVRTRNQAWMTIGAPAMLRQTNVRSEAVRLDQLCHGNRRLKLKLKSLLLRDFERNDFDPTLFHIFHQDMIWIDQDGNRLFVVGRHSFASLIS
jgi:hypothetical protein